MLQKVAFQINGICLSFLFIRHFINLVSAKKLSNLDIRMISEGSCDTEDWIDGAENSALPSQEYIYI